MEGQVKSERPARVKGGIEKAHGEELCVQRRAGGDRSVREGINRYGWEWPNRAGWGQGGTEVRGGWRAPSMLEGNRNNLCKVGSE